MKKQSINIIQLLFLMPVLIAFTIIIIIPFFLGIYYSMTDWARVGVDLNFVGFDNYKNMLTSSTFVYSLKWTVIYTFFNVVIVNLVGLMFAIFVTQKLKFKNIYRAGFFIPNLIGGIVLGTIWSFIFRYGFVAVGEATNISILQNDWLGDPTTAKMALILVGSWQYIGYIMMIYIAALQNVPRDLVEAANIDGANVFQRIRHIIVPMIAPAFTISLFLTLVNSFKQYDINVSLTNGGPAALYEGNQAVMSTQMLAMTIVETSSKTTVENFKGVAQAQAVVFFLILVVVALTQVIVSKRREIEM